MTDTTQGGPFPDGRKLETPLPKDGWNHLKGSNEKPKQHPPKSESEDSEDLSKK